MTVLSTALNCWVLVSIMLLVISVFQGAPFRETFGDAAERQKRWAPGFLATPWEFGKLVSQAFVAMPKVLFSYFFLLSVIAVFVSLAAEFVRRPMLWPFTILLFVVPLFLLWAPVFCAAEVAIKPEKKREDDAADYEDDEESPLKWNRAPVKLFAGRPLWDLGFARSVGFANYAPLLTAQASILLWLAGILPMGLVTILAGYYFTFEWIAIKVLISAVFFSFSVAVICAGFLYVIPKEVMAEFGVAEKKPDVLLRLEPLSVRLSRRRRLLPFLLIVFVGGVSTYFSALWAKHQRVMPETATLKLEQVQQTKEQIVLTIVLEDKDYELRWMDPEAFRLKVIGLKKTDEVKKAEESSGVPTDAQKPEAVKPDAPKAEATKKDESQSESLEPKEELYIPQRVLPTALDGTPLPEADFTPRVEPVRLNIYFENPLAAAASSASIELFHPSIFDLGAPLVKSELPAQTNEIKPHDSRKQAPPAP